VISFPFVIILSGAEQAVLRARANSARAEHRIVIRAKIVLAAAEGHTNAAIASEVGIGITPDTTSTTSYNRLGIDLRAERPKPARIRAAVRRVLTSSMYAANADALRAELHAYDPPCPHRSCIARCVTPTAPRSWQ
jgi:hypothetical protein